MKKMLWIAASTLLVFSPLLHASESGGVVVSHYESLHNLSMGGGNFSDLQKPKQVASPSFIKFDAFGQSFEIDLEPNTRLISKAIQGGLPDEIGVYRGQLKGRPDSWVRIVIADGNPTGLIWDGKQMFAIEAPNDSALNTNSPAIYRLADTYIEPGLLGCGTTGEPGNAAATYQKLTGELDNVIAQAPGAVEELSVGMVGDFEFTNSMGTGADAAILTRMNNVDGIYSEQLGVQITVQTLDTFSDSNDPFTTSVPDDLLAELASYRVVTPTQNSQGLTHMFTGRNLESSTAGVAYRYALCSNRWGAGLSEGRRGATTDSLIAAHEIGHNFGAPHDGESGTACASVSGSFIMASSVNGSDQFSSCSLDIMRQAADIASCISSLPETDVSIGISGQVPNLLLGSTTDLVFDVSNNGTLDATNVEANFTVPTNLSIDSISATSGTCSAGAGQASCSIGTISGTSSQSVTISATATAVGAGTLNASVTADVDSNSGNNQESVQIVVDPATDLLVTGANTLSVTVDSATTITPIVENQSTLTATGVTLDVSFSSGLRVDSASWPNGTCTVSAGSIACQAASLGAQSSATIEVALTATSVGAQTYSATVSSSEADLDESNNAATGTVNVAAAGNNNSNPSSGGGGSVAPFWLVLILLTRILAAVNQLLMPRTACADCRQTPRQSLAYSCPTGHQR